LADGVLIAREALAGLTRRVDFVRAPQAIGSAASLKRAALPRGEAAWGKNAFARIRDARRGRLDVRLHNSILDP